MMVIKRLEYGFGTLYTYQPKPPSTSWWFYQQMAEVENKDQGVEVSGYQVNNINCIIIITMVHKNNTNQIKLNFNNN